MIRCEVILLNKTKKLDRPFSYRASEGMALGVGDLVQVPFGPKNQRAKGLVLSVEEQSKEDPSLKVVFEVLGRGFFKKKDLNLMNFLRAEYLAGYAEALRLLLPPGELVGNQHRIRKVLVAKDPPDSHARGKEYRAIYDYIVKQEALGGVIAREVALAGFSASSVRTMLRHGFLGVEEQRESRAHHGVWAKEEPLELNEEQEAARQKIEEGPAGVYLLHGVTGSGKTEVFLHLVRSVLEAKADAVLLVPEIALTPQMIQRVKGRFGPEVSVYHSRLSEGERYDEWMRIKNGEAHLAIGARSALFLPFADLKLVVVDEEHEMSYKSETNPKYLTREVARFMMQENAGKVLLASATPSLEAYQSAKTGDYQLVELSKRAGAGAMPKIYTVDMRRELRSGNRSILSAALQSAMAQSLEKGRQTILFLNRRGMSGFVSCRACGFVYQCPHCSVSLTKHGGGRLVCHHCGHTEYQKSVCPSCGSRLIKEFGVGTERVEAEVNERFPDARILRMDRDTTSKKESYENIYAQFKAHGADILIGTQMVAKGLDFHGVDLVGILSADLSLNMPDFRAYEKTFQLITQVSGRAGRGDGAGRVILQTYQPEAYPIVFAIQGDYQGFFNQESSIRRALNYPPFGRLFTLILSGQEEPVLIECIQKIARALREALRPYATITIMGSVACRISRLNGWFRQQLVIKGPLSRQMAQKVQQLVYQAVRGKTLRVSLDRNPQDFL